MQDEKVKSQETQGIKKKCEMNKEPRNVNLTCKHFCLNHSTITILC